ncbi:MAG: hypothetical protein Q8N30_01370, partial [Methylococcales bacterium]|nr:hypothetical protein [Methylococcales bacterium]
MTANISDIELGIEFISSDFTGDGEAFLSVATGEVFYRSEYIDEENPLPNDIDDQSKYLPLPHKRDLDLGAVLVFDFVEQQRPDEYAEIRAMFRKKGAYRRFSDWLDRHNLLDDWYRFKNE